MDCCQGLKASHLVAENLCKNAEWFAYTTWFQASGLCTSGSAWEEDKCGVDRAPEPVWHVGSEDRESGLLHEQKGLTAPSTRRPTGHRPCFCGHTSPQGQHLRAEAAAGTREGMLWRGNVGTGRWTWMWREGASLQQGRGLTRYPRVSPLVLGFRPPGL